jgi:hypothetical protein
MLCESLVDMVRKYGRAREGEKSKSSSLSSAPFFALQNLLGLSASAKQAAIDSMNHTSSPLSSSSPGGEGEGRRSPKPLLSPSLRVEICWD